MVDNLLDLALLRKMAHRDTRESSADLETLDEDRDRDELERRDLLQDAVVCGLVKRDGVLRLVLDLALGPLLLFRGLAATTTRLGRSRFCCFWL